MAQLWIGIVFSKTSNSCQLAGFGAEASALIADFLNGSERLDSCERHCAFVERNEDNIIHVVVMYWCKLTMHSRASKIQGRTFRF